MSKINNYKELVAERRRLELCLQKRKADLKEKFNEMKARPKPLDYIFLSLGMFNDKKGLTYSLLKMGTSIGIDLLVRSTPLARAGWIARILLPVVIKGISNQLVNRKVIPR